MASWLVAKLPRGEMTGYRCMTVPSTAADKNTYAGLVFSSFTQYRTRWFENKLIRTFKASVHNAMVREMGKMCFHSRPNTR